MARILHVLTHENDSLACEIISRQQRDPERRVETVHLAREAPDYPALLEKIFEADTVEVW